MIPLPDGRSVPLDMSDVPVMRRLEDWLNKGTGTGGMSAGIASKGNMPGAQTSLRGGVNIARLDVHMTVTTPDVRSFRQSEDQLLQQLEHNIKRSIGRVGTRPAEDDPTRRVG